MWAIEVQDGTTKRSLLVKASARTRCFEIGTVFCGVLTALLFAWACCAIPIAHANGSKSFMLGTSGFVIGLAGCIFFGWLTRALWIEIAGSYIQDEQKLKAAVGLKPPPVQKKPGPQPPTRSPQRKPPPKAG